MTGVGRVADVRHANLDCPFMAGERPPTMVFSGQMLVAFQPYRTMVTDGPLRPSRGPEQLQESSRICASLKASRLAGRPRTQCPRWALSTSEFSAVLCGTTWD